MQAQGNNDELLDLLCLYRDLYARKGPVDRTSAISVEAAVVYAEGLLRVARRREEMAARRNAGRADLTTG